jgi:hypothetical protein
MVCPRRTSIDSPSSHGRMLAEIVSGGPYAGVLPYPFGRLPRQRIDGEGEMEPGFFSTC